MGLHKLPAHLTLFSPAALIATFFGAGLLKPASGTWGSLAALPPGLLIADAYGAPGLMLGTVLAYGLGHWASAAWIDGAPNSADEERNADKDPSPIVIDEVAGMWLTLVPLTLFGAALTPLGVAAAFALFRLFDITKPWPVSWADKQLNGATGVMLDDILAGIWAAIVLLAARQFGLI